MDKNITDDDRIIIGVREWAIQQTLLYGSDVSTPKPVPVDSILNYAGRLEKFVLGEIKNKEAKV